MLGVGRISQPPSGGGGTFTLVRFLYRTLEDTGRSSVAAITRDRGDHGPNRRMSKTHPDHGLPSGVRVENCFGCRTIFIKDRYPDCDPFRYLPTRTWHRVLSCFDVRVLLGGSIVGDRCQRQA